MRRIDLTPYPIPGTPDITFNIRESLAAVVFNEKKLDAREVIRRDELARKIETHPDAIILLEEIEWKKIVAGLDATDLVGYGRTVVELLRRVLDAPDVAVKEAK